MQIKKQESGSITFSILMILMLLVIAFLVYILMGGELPKKTKTIGVTSPSQNLYEDKSDISGGEFSDGLINPSFSEKYSLDEFGVGIASKEIFDYDINDDGKNDRITKTKHENGTDHFWYEYKIEVNQNGNFIDVTPSGFRTTEGADCALQKLKFIFKPDFRVIKISRKWEESWVKPTMAKKTTYAFSGKNLQEIESENLKEICDVSELF